MDPVSVVGLAISAGSIAFQILGGCIKGFVLLSYINEFGKDSAVYICMLNLQKLRLVEWSKRAGLLADPPCLNPRLSEPSVCAVLRALQSLLFDTTKLRTRYNMTYSDMPKKSTTAQSQSGPVDQAASLFEEAVSNDMRRDIMNRAGVIESNVHWPKRVWWAAVDRNKVQELIQNIRILTTELWRMLDPLRQDDMSQSLQIIMSHVIGITESIDGMKTLQQALQQDKAAPIDQFEGSALTSVAELKLRSMQLSTRRQETTDSVVEEMSKDGVADPTLHRVSYPTEYFEVDVDIDLITNFSALQNSESIGTALYKGTPVLIEHKTLPTFSKSKLFQCVKDLAVLLSAPKDPSFHCLRCCALASNATHSSLAFVFNLQPTLTNDSPSLFYPQFVSLRNIYSLSPSITTRISLALKLVQSLRWFHAANWLHKDIRSEHILFPPTPSGPDLSNPLIAGFAYSRADSPAAIGEQPSSNWQRDLYRHPDAMGEPTAAFTKDKDIYALAAVLVEIGEWRSLKSILGGLVETHRYDVSLVELSKVKPWLQDKGVRGLSFRIGEIYTEVVSMMLTNEIPEPLRMGEGVRRAGVLDTAVRELVRCII